MYSVRLYSASCRAAKADVPSFGYIYASIQHTSCQVQSCRPLIIYLYYHQTSVNHSGKWTATEFDYTNSNFDGIYMYLHGECHFLLTFTCAVFCGGLLVCVFTLLVLMWFYLFDWLLNVSSSPSVGMTHPDSADDHNTETWKHRGETPKPPTLVSLCSRCVFHLFLASPSFSLF